VQRFSGARPELSINTLSVAGSLIGIENTNQGSALEWVSTLAIKNQRDDHAHNTKIKPSLEASWRVQPSLQASITINTDFAETEVDEVQSNYTRFPLFVPEQRDFFFKLCKLL
jgi:hypothetical protein